MAINPSTDSTMMGRITPPDDAYPYGSAKDESTPGSGDGTPYFKKRADDIFGFQQALLKAGSVTPNGDADTVELSQYVQALQKMTSDANLICRAERQAGAANVYRIEPPITAQVYRNLFPEMNFLLGFTAANLAGDVNADVSPLLGQAIGTSIVPIKLFGGNTNPQAGALSISRLHRVIMKYLPTPHLELVATIENSSPLRGQAVFGQSGVYNWTVPDNVFRLWVTVVGGGGQAGNGSATAVGGGGGAGATRETVISVTPGTVLPITVGAGGYSASANGANGGASSVGGVSGPGGLGGSGSASTSYGGGKGGFLSSDSTGAGLLALSGGDGTDGRNGTTDQGGAGCGGASSMGGGARSGIFPTGQDGNAPGAGGGSNVGPGGSKIGGRGADGIVILRW